MVLANNACKIKKTHALASWLHGVVFRTAMLARRRATVRRRHEKARSELSQPTAKTDEGWKELLNLLDDLRGADVVVVNDGGRMQ